MSELPLITILALERANKNCYEKGLWVITNLQEKDHRKTTEIENRYVLLVPFLQNLLCTELQPSGYFSLQFLNLLLFFIVVPARQAVNLTRVNSK